jgi:hypothetical protein
LAEGFQRRRLKCEKLTDDRQRTPSDGKSSHCLWQGELKISLCVYSLQIKIQVVNKDKRFILLRVTNKSFYVPTAYKSKYK